MTATNHFEARGREKKSRYLAAAIDGALTAVGIEPCSDYAVQMVRAFGEKEWAAAVVQAAKDSGIGYDHASAETRALVVEMFERRVASMQSLHREVDAEIDRAELALGSGR